MINAVFGSQKTMQHEIKFTHQAVEPDSKQNECNFFYIVYIFIYKNKLFVFSNKLFVFYELQFSNIFSGFACTPRM